MRTKVENCLTVKQQITRLFLSETTKEFIEEKLKGIYIENEKNRNKA